jgi:hypothetical protein
LSIASQIDGYKIHPIFQPIEKLVTNSQMENIFHDFEDENY